MYLHIPNQLWFQLLLAPFIYSIIIYSKARKPEHSFSSFHPCIYKSTLYSSWWASGRPSPQPSPSKPSIRAKILGIFSLHTAKSRKINGPDTRGSSSIRNVSSITSVRNTENANGLGFPNPSTPRQGTAPPGKRRQRQRPIAKTESFAATVSSQDVALAKQWDSASARSIRRVINVRRNPIFNYIPFAPLGPLFLINPAVG